MNYPIDIKQVTNKIEFQTEVIKEYKEAAEYLLGFPWCWKIVNAQLYLNLGSTLCIFLFEIENSASSEDNYLWVVVGDIPPMYLDIHGPKSTKEVLEDYVRLAEDWIFHVKSGKSIENCYPFNAALTLEMAELLEERTVFMKNTLIKNIEDVPLLIK
jgi:hypothetical protein